MLMGDIETILSGDFSIRYLSQVTEGHRKTSERSNDYDRMFTSFLEDSKSNIFV